MNFMRLNLLQKLAEEFQTIKIKSDYLLGQVRGIECSFFNVVFKLSINLWAEEEYEVTIVWISDEIFVWLIN